MRFLLALASTQNRFLHKLNVDNSFLHGDLEEEVYMRPPQGLHLPQPNLVCKL
uniref:Retrovirus-related Pol polyprotein from transposon TNT 1-94 n=1 Tax=Cajanus cajan TaxID=3821 RepID=A0A151T3T3_CAJCA|nr:Retrovirus-related Pol polyprotein from transposon TNT 1-94 [Cajanus cajan]